MPYDKTFEAWMKSNPPWALNQGIAGQTGSASDVANLAPAAQPGYSLSPEVSSQQATVSEGPNGLQRFLSLLGVAENAVIGGVHGVQEMRQEARSGNFDIADLMRLPGGVASGLSEGFQSVFGNEDKIKYSTDVAVGEYAMGGADPLGFDTSKYGEATKNMTAEEYNKYIDEVVKPEYMKYQQTDSPGETTARTIGAFAGDVGFDPLTYVSLGLVPLAKQAIKKIAPETAAKVAAGVEKLGETKPNTAAFLKNIGNRPTMFKANGPTPQYNAALAEKLGTNVPEGVSPGVAVAAQADNIEEKLQQTIVSPDQQALIDQTMGVNLGQETLGSPGPVGFSGLPIGSTRQPIAAIEAAPVAPVAEQAPIPMSGQAAVPQADPNQIPLFTDRGSPIAIGGSTAAPAAASSAAKQIPGQENMFPDFNEQIPLFPSEQAGPQVLSPTAQDAPLPGPNPVAPTQREILFTKKGEVAKAAEPLEYPTDIGEAGGSSHYRYKDGTVHVYDEAGQLTKSYDNVVYLDPASAAAVQARVAAGRPAIDKMGNILGQMGTGKAGKIAAKNISKEPQAGLVPLFHSADGAEVKFGNAVDSITPPKKVGENPAAPTKAADETPVATETPVAKEPIETTVPKSEVSKAKIDYKVNPPTKHQNRKATTKLEADITAQAVIAMFLKGKGNIFGFSREVGRRQLKNGKGYISAMTPNGVVQIRIPDLVDAILNPNNGKIPFVYGAREGGEVAGIPTLSILRPDGTPNPNLSKVSVTFPNQAAKTPITLQDLVDHATEAVAWATKKVNGEQAERAAEAAAARAAQKAASEPVINAPDAAKAEAAKPAAEAAYQEQKVAESPIPKTPEQPEHRLDTSVTDGVPEPTLQFTEKPIKPKRKTAEEKQAERKLAVLDELLAEMEKELSTIRIQPVKGQGWIPLTEKGTPKYWKIYNEQGFEALANALQGRVAQGVNTIANQANLVRNAHGILSRVFLSGRGRDLELKGGFTRDLVGKNINPSKVGADAAEMVETASKRAQNAWAFLKTLEREAAAAGALPVASLNHRIFMPLSDRLELAANDLGIPKEWTLLPYNSHEAAALLTTEQQEALRLLWKNADYIDGSFDVMRYSGGRARSEEQMVKSLADRVSTYEQLQTYFPSLQGNFGGPVKDLAGKPTSRPKVPTKSQVQANPTAATSQAVAAGADPTVVATINRDAAGELMDDAMPPDFHSWNGGKDDFAAMAEDAKLGAPEYKGGQAFLVWHSSVYGHRNLGSILWNNLGIGKRLGGDFDHWLKEVVDVKATPEEMKLAMQKVIARTLSDTRHDPVSPDKVGTVVKMIEDRVIRLFGKEDSIMSRANVSQEQLVHYLRGLGVNLPATITKGNSDNYFVDLMSQMSNSLLDGKEQLKFMSQFQGALNRAMTHNFLYADIMANLGSPIKIATHTTKFGNHYFEPQVAKQLPSLIQRFEDLNTYSANGKAFFNSLDDVLGVWKTAVTIPRPGHHIRNMIGDLFMSWFSNPRIFGNPAAMVRDYKRAVQILKHHEDAYGGILRTDKNGNTENLDQITALVEQLAMGDRTGLNGIAPKANKTAATDKMIQVGGRSLTSSDIYTQAFNRGLLQNAHVIEDIGNLEGSKFAMTTRMRSLPWIKQMGQLTNVREHSVRLMDFVGDLEYGLNKKFKGRKNISEQEWNAAIKEIADFSAERIRKIHPDGLKLTPQERNYWRRAMPFYSYTRGIIPAVAEYAIANPGRAVAPMKAYRDAQMSIMGVDTEYGYDPTTPRLPAWMYENYGMGPLFSLPAANGGSSIMGTDLYGVGSYDVPRMIANPGDNFLGMLSPMIKMPIEIASQRNLQTGQDITSMGDYAMKQLPMANLFYDTSKPGNQDMSWVNFLTGGRVTEMNKPSYYTSAEFEKKANG